MEPIRRYSIQTRQGQEVSYVYAEDQAAAALAYLAGTAAIDVVPCCDDEQMCSVCQAELADYATDRLINAGLGK